MKGYEKFTVANIEYFDIDEPGIRRTEKPGTAFCRQADVR
jgi:hypothetical protein